jgi:hypothetical protein
VSWRFTYHAIYRYAKRAGLTVGQAKAELHRLRSRAVLAGVSDDAVRFRCPNGCTLMVKPDGAVVTAYWPGEKDGHRVMRRATLSGGARPLIAGKGRGRKRRRR